MATTRGDFAGTGKTIINGTTFSEAADTTAEPTGKLTRVLTQGHTGETMDDPTGVEIKWEGAVLRRRSMTRRLQGWQDTQEDVTVRVEIGDNVVMARGKLHGLTFKTTNGKSTFTGGFMGDRQGARP